MAVDDANRFWADPELRAAVLRHRPGDRPPPPLLRHRRPRRRPPGGPDGVRRDPRAGPVARPRGRGRRAADRPSRRAADPARLPRSGCATAAPRRVWVEKILEPVASGCATGRCAGRSATSSSTTSVRCSSTRAAEQPLTALWGRSPGDPRAVRRRSRSRPSSSRPADRSRREIERLAQRRVRLIPVESSCSRRSRAAGLPHLRRPGRRARWPTPTARRSPPPDRPGGSARGCCSTRRRRPSSSTRFQQTTPAVIAKGVEDTAFYRYARLLALNDVGGYPVGSASTSTISTPPAPSAARAVPAGDADDDDPRHQALGRRAGADRRAVVDARASGSDTSAAGWRSTDVAALGRGAHRTTLERYFLLQTLVGVWPIERERMQRVHGQGAARGQAQHQLGRRRRRLGGAASRASSTRLYDDYEFRSELRAVRRRGWRSRRADPLGMLALKLTVAGRPRHLPGRRARVLRSSTPTTAGRSTGAGAEAMRRPAACGGASRLGSGHCASCALTRALLGLRIRRPTAFGPTASYRAARTSATTRSRSCAAARCWSCVATRAEARRPAS